MAEAAAYFSTVPMVGVKAMISKVDFQGMPFSWRKCNTLTALFSGLSINADTLERVCNGLDGKD